MKLTKRRASIAAVAFGAGLLLTYAVVALAEPQQQVSTRSLGVAQADAARLCRSALEAEARRRIVDAGPTRGATATVAGLDAADPQWAAGRWTVEGTIHYMIVTGLGGIPADVYVLCSVRGRAASVANRS